MKTVIIIFLAGILALGGCKKGGDTPVTPATPEYQTAIDAKYKALGWAQGADNGGKPQQTAGKKGWVQYYGTKDRAIYFFNGSAYGFLKNEMAKYDALGQDNFTALGLPTSDGIGFAAGISGNEFEKGVIVSDPAGVFVVSGPIYAKYKAIGRWDSPLGYPTTDEGIMTTRKEGRYQVFTKTGPFGQIYWSSATGAQAFWGKVETMYRPVGYDGGWLGLPTSSCDASQPDNKQLVRFEKGVISTGPTCPSYLNGSNETVLKDGTRAANVSSIPCY